MCTVSMVYDHFGPKFPDPLAPRPMQPLQPLPIVPLIDWEQVAKDVRAFREAAEAAKIVDKLTGQPDCVDPEKAKLVERVEALEKQIEEMKRKKKPQRRLAKRKEGKRT